MSDPEGEDVPGEIDVVLMKPDSRGSVRLRSAEPLDVQAIMLPRLVEASDVECLEEGLRFAADVARHAAVRRSAGGAPAPIPEHRKERRRAVIEGVYSIPHTVGTCRMGPSPDTGDVVDPMGHVYGVEGLSVIDASVIPGPTAGFPHIVTIMLADLIADRITALASDRPAPRG
jgi:choline dehydrogenase-like flavoprotein